MNFLKKFKEKKLKKQLSFYGVSSLAELHRRRSFNVFATEYEGKWYEDDDFILGKPRKEAIPLEDMLEGK